MSELITCKASVVSGFYQQVCGHKYGGKVFQCTECREEQEAQEAEKELNNDDLLAMSESLVRLEGAMPLSDRESALRVKLYSLLGL